MTESKLHWTSLQLITIWNSSDVFSRWQKYQTASNKKAS